ncbi:MAG: hypothetical protein CVT92_05145 [Bacteroidetes bacterium HGW-Bacteroidetes-1]|jgi:effector-binding domain-containing protein|nr:MAG: hypothetical protein CVT92_05145 [Bacteroidetes bacterium HGW-Bacteroidetes-1]
MKALKFIGILLLLLLVVLLTLPALMPNHAETSQSIFINTKAQTVFRLVNSLQNWSKWSPFEFGDPEMESVYDGPVMGIGNKHTWKSKSMGDGSMTILQSQPYEFIQSLLDMDGSGIAFDEWTFIEKEGGVEVTWSLKLSDLKYPFHRYFGFFLESMMKPMQEKGLQKLKEIAEATRPSIEIELIELTPQPSITILDSAMMDGIDQLMANNMNELGQYMDRTRIEPIGPAFAMYHNWETDKAIKMQVGFPVAEEVKESGRTSYYIRPGGKALKGTMMGPYSGAENAHNDLDACIKDFGYNYSALPVWESYEINPHNEPDTLKWLTTIYYYIE